MAVILSSFSAQSLNAISSYKIPIGENQDGDLIVIAWQKMSNTASAHPTATGFSNGPSANNGWSASGFIYKHNSGGSTASPVTLSFGGNADITCQSYVIRGVAASPIGATATSTNGGNATATLPAARVTTTANNSLVLHSCGARLAVPYMPTGSTFNPLGTGFMNQEVAGVSGSDFVATSGAQSPAFDFKGYASASCSAVAMEVKSDGTSMPICVTSGRTVIDYNAWNDTSHTWYAPNDATIGISSIAGVSMSAYNGSINYGPYQSSIAGYWCRRGIYYLTSSVLWEGKWESVSVDLTGKVLCVPWSRNRASDDRVGEKGVICVLVDINKNYKAYTLRSVEDGWSGTLWYTKFIKDGVTPTLATGGPGTFDISQIRFIGYFVEGTTAVGGGECYLRLGPVWCEDSPTVFTGGGPSTPLDVEKIHRHLFSDRQWIGISSLQGTKQYLGAINHQIGNGTNKTYLKTGGQSFALRDFNVDYVLGEGDVGLRLKGSADCVFDMSASIAVGESKQSLTIDSGSSTSADYLLSGLSAINFSGVWKTGVPCTLVTFSECHDVDGKAQKFDTCSFALCQLTSGAYLRLDGGAASDWSDASGAVSCSFAKGNETYAIELRTAGYYDLTDATFSGYTNELHVSAASGTVKIKLATGQPQPDVYNPNSCTIDFVQPTVDVTFAGLVAGSQVKVFAQGTTTELFSTTNSGTSEVWTPASGAYDYTVMKAGYRPVRGSGTSPSASISIAPQQQIDRVYVASSGLTYGTNCSVNLGTKKFGLTVPSTLQNFYSYMIEQWISNAALKNQDFPITPNGSASFSFDLGWEWDGSTSIANSSRDGLRYTNGGTVTAMWAALLSVGVPAGMQVRYQQQDGLGTTNAQATGNIDQLIQIYGDATHGNFDYRNWLVLKVQAEGYDQAEAVVLDIYPTLDDQLFAVGLTPLANGVAAQAGITGITITAEPTPVLWNGQYFSTTIKDTTDSHTGLQVMQYVRSLNDFNMHDMIRPNGAKFKTVTGNVYGDTLTTPAGVRVVMADGTTPHPDFDLFTADDGTTYAPPVTATINITNLPVAGNLIRLQIYNMSTDTIIYSDDPAGTSYTDSYTNGVGITGGDTLRVRFVELNAGTSFKFFNVLIEAAITGFNIDANNYLETDTVYAWNATNGSGTTVTDKFSADFSLTNPEINLKVTSNFTAAEYYSFWRYLLTDETGIGVFWGAITANDVGNYQTNTGVVDMYLDNTTTASQRQTDAARIYRSDGLYPVLEPTTSKYGIDINWMNVVYVVSVSGSSALSPTESAKLMSLPAAAATASAVRTELEPELSYVDAAISTRLASASYTTPDNAGIAALPTLAEIEATTILAKEATVSALPAATLAAAQATPIHSEVDKINGAAVIGDGSELDPWRAVGVTP